VSRPLIGIPARLASSTSALRYAAAVNARALLTMVHAAGGEPLSVLPWPDIDALSAREVAERLAFVDGILLPGGGDLDPRRYGQDVDSEHLYDIDDVQDSMDLAVAAWALDHGVPLFAVCRGLHVVNVALGGTLEQHMEEPHREVVHTEVRHTVEVDGDGWPKGVDVTDDLAVSCYHHQRIDTLGSGLRTLARADDATVEAVATVGRDGWFLGVQWHPEDMADDAQQRAIVGAFVDAARLQQDR